MENLFKGIITEIGEDLNREGLLRTPNRAANALKDLTKGYTQNIDEVINDAIYSVDSDDMIMVRDIELYSLCEHHMLPFFGKCHIGYIPQGKVIGVSKLARIADVFARRMQIQENLTRQIADTVMQYTGAEGVGVIIEAQHLCMMMRGVSKQNSVMKTSCMLGSFRDDINTRTEFVNLIKN
jgi:GTP cyclohydrolase I